MADKRTGTCEYASYFLSIEQTVPEKLQEWINKIHGGK
jgi:uncharacterized protein (DUF2344 family)